MNFHLRKDFLKINQIEINKEYAYISVKIPKENMIEIFSYFGILIEIQLNML